jgi:hypothetical protein
MYSVCIDISAKIEAWDKDSIVAIANNHAVAFCVPAAVKQKAMATFRTREPVQFVLLAIFAYLAVRPKLSEIHRITIDLDYSGAVAHRIIVRRLVELIRRDRPGFRASWIRIDNVAGHRADLLAREVYRGLRSADGEIQWEQIESLLSSQ